MPPRVRRRLPRSTTPLFLTLPLLAGCPPSSASPGEASTPGEDDAPDRDRGPGADRGSPAEPSRPGSERVPGPRPRLAGPAAHDLALRPGGAWLLVGEPPGAAPRGWLMAHPLDGRGTPDGPPIRVAEAAAGHAFREVATASSGGRLVVVWIEGAPDGGDHRVRAAGGAAGIFGPPVDLGPTIAPPVPGRRGGLALAFADDRTGPTLFHRGDRTPCRASVPPDAPKDCVGIRRRALDPTGAPVSGDERGGVALALPQPCPETLPGLVRLGSTAFYGLCDESGGAPETAFYTIQQDPRYARADPILTGCLPRGLVVLSDARVLALGACGGGEADDGRLEIWEARLGGDAPVRLGSSQRRWGCAEGRPVLALPDVGRHLPLGPPAAGLGSVAPPRPGETHDVRTVWTGEALLSAGPDPEARDTLALVRHRCAADPGPSPAQ